MRCEGDPTQTDTGSEAEIPWSAIGLQEWFVLHVKSRQEKALSHDLNLACIPHYLPLVREAKYYGTRKAFVRKPLFPGYLFLRGSIEEAYRAANRTHRVARILRVTNQEQLEEELRNLYIALAKRASLQVYPYLKKGIRVAVRAGPFRGLQGVIRDMTSQNRLILQVEMLGKAASLEIDGALLDRVE